MVDKPRFSLDDMMDRTEDIVRVGKTLDGFILETGLYREQMGGKLDGIHGRLGKIEEVLLVGNGERALVEQVHAIQKTCQERGERKKEGVVSRLAFWTAVVTALIGGIFALVVALANSGSSNTDADRLQADEVRQILQIVREEEQEDLLPIRKHHGDN